jgi:AraC family transcriptional regulator
MRTSIDPVERLRSAETGGLMLTEFAQPPSLKVPRHYHECATVFFTIKGFAADRMAGRAWECNPSSILIRPAGESHTHQYGHTGARGLVIEIKPERLVQVRSFSQILDRVGHFNESFLADLGMRLYMESRIMDSASELAIEGLVLEMLAQATRLNSKSDSLPAQPHWLSHARNFIQENYAEPLSLSQVAKIVGVHSAHLAEVFRKSYGCTIGQYIRRLRLDYAARELMISEKSLAEISATAGFYDQSHFTRIFKRHIGRCPSEIRRLARTPKAHTKSLRMSKLS